LRLLPTPWLHPLRSAMLSGLSSRLPRDAARDFGAGRAVIAIPWRRDASVRGDTTLALRDRSAGLTERAEFNGRCGRTFLVRPFFFGIPTVTADGKGQGAGRSRRQERPIQPRVEVMVTGASIPSLVPPQRNRRGPVSFPRTGLLHARTLGSKKGSAGDAAPRQHMNSF